TLLPRPLGLRALSRGCGARTYSTASNVVNIVEVGPRDGLQNEKGIIPVSVKAELVSCLGRAGVEIIEAGSFISPKWVPQMAGTADVLLQAERFRNVRYPVLVPNQKCLDAVAALLTKHSVSPPLTHEISIFAAATDAFTRANLNTTTAESLERLAPVVAAALDRGLRVRGYVSVVIACPYSGQVDYVRVRDVAKALIDMGCYEVSLGDTVGMGTLTQVSEMLEEVKKSIPVANHGVRTIDASVGGLGGCPYSPGATGNVVTEDYHVYGTADGIVDLDQMVDIGWWISEQLGRESTNRAGRAIRARRRREAQAKAKL
ncbi:hypothetical protein DFH08DRAFT_888800, partial [Mycena albidolilacea]